MYRTTLVSPSSRARLAPLAICAFLAACGSSSSDSGIPLAIDEDETIANDTPATANTLKVGTPIRGSVAVAGDVDCFALQLSAGTVVQFELFATRSDQAGWDAVPNVPRLTLLDTDLNANAKLLEHDFSGNFSDGWDWGFHDLDIPMFFVPVSGIYFIAVTQDDDTLAGGSYILRASKVSVSGLQEEVEARLVSGDNDTFGTAEAIHTGTVHGFHVADELDYFSFTVSSPTVVRFAMNAYRNGVHDGTALYYDPIINLYDTDGTTLLTTNDDVYFFDSSIEYEIDTAGTYFLAVDQFAVGMSGEYFLSYATSPVGSAAESEPNEDVATADPISYNGRRNGAVDVGETDFYKFNGTAGDMVRLQYFDSGNAQGASDSITISMLAPDGVTALATGGDGELQILTTILTETGTFYVKVEGGAALTTYGIELKRFLSATWETEPNDTDVEAGTLKTRVAGVIDVSGDQDMYKVNLKLDQFVRVVCYTSNSFTDSNGDPDHAGFGSDLAPLLEIVDDAGTVVASSTSFPTNIVYTESVTQPLPTCGLAFTAAASGTYFVRISDATAGFAATDYYVLEYTKD